jgi:hypothetical protein
MDRETIGDKLAKIIIYVGYVIITLGPLFLLVNLGEWLSGPPKNPRDCQPDRTEICR